jgi:hypothetical protein
MNIKEWNETVDEETAKIIPLVRDGLGNTPETWEEYETLMLNFLNVVGEATEIYKKENGVQK